MIGDLSRTQMAISVVQSGDTRFIAAVNRAPWQRVTGYPQFIS
jgi:hypothetical protein